MNHIHVAKARVERKKKKPIDLKKKITRLRKTVLDIETDFVIKYPFQKTVRIRQCNGQFVLRFSVLSKAVHTRATHVLPAHPPHQSTGLTED